MGHAGEFTQLEISEVLNPDPDAGSEDSEYQAQGTSRRPQQKQTEQGENGRHTVEKDHHLAVRESVLQKFVMDVLGVGGKDGASADQAAQNGEGGLENRKSEGNYRNGDGDDGGSLLGAFEGEGAQQKSDEEAAGVSQEDGRRIEVEAEESEDGAGERDGHHGDEGVSVEQRDNEGHQRREQGRACGKAIQAIDQVKSVGDGEDPQNGEGQAHEPGKLMGSEQNRDVDDAEAA